MMKHIKYLTVLMIWFSVNGHAQSTAKVISEQPLVLGKVIRLHSNFLNENRDINIYLPAGYSDTGNNKYQVFYLLDGGMDEDFIHVTGLVQFNTFSWVQRMPKSIVVGITNTDRKRDFTFPTSLEDDRKRYPSAGKSANFIAFLGQELQPFIEGRFRTNETKILIGQSLGGLLATEILMNQPNLFTHYIIISPSLWWDDGSILLKTSSALQILKTPLSVYIGVGKEGVWPGKTPHVSEVDANLLADKLRSYQNPQLKVFFDYLPNEDHATVGHQAVENAFKVLFSAP